MNRSELAQHVAEQAGINRKTADDAIDAIFGAVMAETKRGEKVQLFGFGTFTPTSRDARMGRNPQTGEPVKIAASKSVRFSPAAAFKTALNGKAKAAKATKATSKKAGGAKKAAPARKAASKSTASKTTSRAAKKTARKR